MKTIFLAQSARDQRRAVIFKRNHVCIFCRLSTMRGGDRQTDHGTVTSIALGKITCQRCRLKYTETLKRFFSTNFITSATPFFL